MRSHKQYVQYLSKDNIRCTSGINIRTMFFNLSTIFGSDVSLHNFGGGNTLSAFAETILELIDVLQSGSEIVID